MSLYTRRAEELRHRGRQRAEYGRFLAARLDRRALLRRAWNIAWGGARRFGGRVRLYFAAALRQVWAETKVRLATVRAMAEDRYALTVVGVLALREAEAALPGTRRGDQLELALA